MVVRIKHFEKGYLPSSSGLISWPMKILANFISKYCDWKTSGNSLSRSKRFFGNYSGKYNIISLRLKKSLKTQTFEKKGYLSSEDKIPAYFSRIIERNKLDVTTNKVAKENVVWQLLLKLWDHFCNT